MYHQRFYTLLFSGVQSSVTPKGLPIQSPLGRIDASTYYRTNHGVVGMVRRSGRMVGHSEKADKRGVREDYSREVPDHD